MLNAFGWYMVHWWGVVISTCCHDAISCNKLSYFLVWFRVRNISPVTVRSTFDELEAIGLEVGFCALAHWQDCDLKVVARGQGIQNGGEHDQQWERENPFGFKNSCEIQDFGSRQFLTSVSKSNLLHESRDFDVLKADICVFVGKTLCLEMFMLEGSIGHSWLVCFLCVAVPASPPI